MQTKWVAMLLNKGVNPYTNETIVPSSVIDATTSAYSIIDGKASRQDTSLVGYGMGWGRLSYRGHEVGLFTICAF
jgi:hypothetical protein